MGRGNGMGMRVGRAIVMMTAVAGISAAAEMVRAAPPEARVQFTTTVSGASPFGETCDDRREASGITGAEVEPHLAVDPREPDHLLATWQQDRYDRGGGARSNVVAVSRDGGTTWGRRALPGLSTCTDPTNRFTRATDPWGAIGPDGIAYQAGNAFLLTDTDADLDVTVNFAEDGGSVWGAATTVAADDGTYLHERPVIAADPQRPGVAYVVWAQHLEPDPDVAGPLQALDVAIGFSSTKDGGETWTEADVVPPNVPEVMEWPYGLVVVAQPDSDASRVVVLYASELGRFVHGASPSSFRSVYSDDSGETWSDPVDIGHALNPLPTGDFEQFVPIAAGPGNLSAAAGPDGSVHVAWADRTLQGDDHQGGSVIHHARSVDGAASWDRTVVGEFPRQAFLPAVAVSGDGAVGVTFYDLRNDELGDDAPELTTDVWLRYSRDDGGRWDEIHLAGPFDFRQAPLSDERYMLGDYHGIVGFPNGFGALYAVAPPVADDGPSDVLFSRVKLTPHSMSDS